MRYVLVVVGLLLVIGALVAVKGKQIGSLIAMGKQMEKSGPPPEAVASAVAKQESWQGTISSVGSVTAAKGVAVSNEVPGIVTRINFESGSTVKEGQVLVELDTSVERAQLATAEAHRELAQQTVERTRTLLAKGAVTKAQIEADESTFKTSGTDIDQIRTQIARKSVRAPFSGRLGIRNVNIGQYLNPGTAITGISAIDIVYVDFTVPQQRLADVPIGLPVKVVVEGAKGDPIQGQIAAVDPNVDESTRNLKLRAHVPNKDERLRPGMFVNVEVELPKHADFVIVPATSILHASYGDSVFVVEDRKPDSPGSATTADGKPVKIARQQFVRLGEARGDFVAVLDGVKTGQEIVSAGAFKLRNNAAIWINQDVKQDPQLAPHPENR